MEFIINCLTYILLYPFIAMIHELGHGFFVKLFGGEVNRIGFGSGGSTFQVKKLFIGTHTRWAGMIYWTISNKISRGKEILILLGGVIFNFMTGVLIWLFIWYYDFQSLILSNTIVFSFVAVLTSLIPFTLSDGIDTDGKQILKLIKEASADRASNRKGA